MSKATRSAGFATLALTLTAGLIGALAAEPAAAYQLSDIEQREIRISARGLDVATEAGQDLLRARVASAIRRVCAAGNGPSAVREELACRAGAEVSTAPQIAGLFERAERLAAAGGASDQTETATAIAVRRD